MQQWFQTWHEKMNTKLSNAQPLKDQKITSQKIRVPAQLISEFDIKIWGTEKVRAATKLYTNKGILALKKTNISPAHLTFITEGIYYLHQKNFHKVIEYLPLKKGGYFYQDIDYSYILSNWIDGKESNMLDPYQEYQASITMAQFHKASKEFKSSIDISKISRLGHLEEDLRKHVNEFEIFLNLSQNASPIGTLENLIIQNNLSFHKKAQKSLELLNKFNYNHFIHKAQNTLALLHQDFAYHNLIWINGEIHLIDPDYLTYDLRCIDLVKFLRRNLRLGDWKMRIAENIIKGYTSVNPLDPEELTLIYILLYFPYKYWQSLHLYFFENNNQPNRLYRNLNKLLRQQKKKDDFLERFAKKYLSAVHL